MNTVHAAPPPLLRPEMPVRLRDVLLVTALVFLSFAVYATWHAPPPGANEPHYLCKAKHLWNPGWCSRDQFLQSANAHWLFLQTIGGLTRILSLEQTAWVGRIAAWLLLAWGWTQLANAVVPGRWGSLWSAWCFLAIATFGNFSGEWIVGGVESKVFSYACLFAALAYAIRSEWRKGSVWCGLAIAWHPVVGVWGLIAGLFALLPDAVSQWRAVQQSWRQLAVAGSLLVLCALPGLVPTLSMLAASPSAEVTRTANAIQVFDRLAHHLNPERFPPRAYVEYAILLGAWLVLRRAGRWREREGRFRWFVWGAALIAVAGLAVGFGWRNAGLMKFYPFRLFDAVLPLAVGIGLAGVVQRCRDQLGASSPRWFSLSALVGLSALMAIALPYPPSAADPSHLGPERRPDYQDACRWIRENTPAESLFLTSRYLVDFKWRAERAEYVSIKDCPQDAAGIVEWRRRLDLVSRWRRAHFTTAFTESAVAELVEATGVDYVLAWNIPSHDPYRRPAEYKNRWFAVYKTKP